MDDPVVMKAPGTFDPITPKTVEVPPVQVIGHWNDVVVLPRVARVLTCAGFAVGRDSTVH